LASDDEEGFAARYRLDVDDAARDVEATRGAARRRRWRSLTPRQRICLGVEGPHAIELVGRLLDRRGLKRVQLVARAPGPTSFGAGELQISASVVISRTTIALTINSDYTLPTQGAREPDPSVSVLDTEAPSPEEQRRALGAPRISPSELAGARAAERCGVTIEGYRFSAAMFAIDAPQGRLRDLLLESARGFYPRLFREAKASLKLVERESERLKALGAAIAASPDPERSIQASIQDNRWVSEVTSKIPAAKVCVDFMTALLGRALSTRT
jgi:hypothetical protein